MFTLKEKQEKESQKQNNIIADYVVNSSEKENQKFM
jgi:hypothetical protein